MKSVGIPGLLQSCCGAKERWLVTGGAASNSRHLHRVRLHHSLLSMDCLYSLGSCMPARRSACISLGPYLYL